MSKNVTYSTLAKRIVFFSISTLIVSSLAHAKFFVNSICHMKTNDKNKVIAGDDNKTKKYPLASLSKIATTLWAIEKLGIDYRHSTKIHITEIAQGSYDVHIEGSRDPFFGQRMGYFLISELNKMQIRKIERLTFDENFLLKWAVESPIVAGGTTANFETIEQQVRYIKKSLEVDFASQISMTAYKRLRNLTPVKMTPDPSLNVRHIDFVSRSTFQKTANTRTFVLRSAPLVTVLKKMNNQSNNYIADHLYWNMGGTDAFTQFIQKKLSFTSQDLVFYNGSGNNDGSSQAPIYNMGSCESVIKTIYALDRELIQRGKTLEDVIAVSGIDQDSTVKNFPLEGSMTAKTGTVNKAKTLAGTIATSEGELIFAILLHTDGPSDWGSAHNSILRRVQKIAQDMGGAIRMGYKELRTLPFDEMSQLVEESSLLQKAP